MIDVKFKKSTIRTPAMAMNYEKTYFVVLTSTHDSSFTCAQKHRPKRRQNYTNVISGLLGIIASVGTRRYRWSRTRLKFPSLAISATIKKI